MVNPAVAKGEPALFFIAGQGHLVGDRGGWAAPVPHHASLSPNKNWTERAK